MACRNERDCFHNGCKFVKAKFFEGKVIIALSMFFSLHVCILY